MDAVGDEVKRMQFIDEPSAEILLNQICPKSSKTRPT
jgi:hypothetical protein